MSRRFVYLVVVMAAMTIVGGCSSASGTQAPVGQTQTSGSTQVASSRQPTSRPPASATQRQGSVAPQACSVLTKDQVNTEFGAIFPVGTVGTTVPPVSATASSTCKFHTTTSAGNPWTITVYVFGFASDAAANDQMTQYRKTTLSTGTANWAIVELPGVGDDAIYHNLLSLRDTQEEVIVRKGSVIYWLLDTRITGIPDVTASRNHLVALARLAISH